MWWCVCVLDGTLHRPSVRPRTPTQVLALLLRATVTVIDDPDANEEEGAGADGEAGGRRRRVAALRPEDVGVIVPYRAQAGAIQRVMKVGGWVGWAGGADRTCTCTCINVKRNRLSK